MGNKRFSYRNCSEMGLADDREGRYQEEEQSCGSSGGEGRGGNGKRKISRGDEFSSASPLETPVCKSLFLSFPKGMNPSKESRGSVKCVAVYWF